MSGEKQADIFFMNLR